MPRRRDISRQHWEVEQAPSGAWTWTREIGDRDEPSTVEIYADSRDEHADQNVNWQITDYFGWHVLKRDGGRGHARSVRAAMKQLEEK